LSLNLKGLFQKPTNPEKKSFFNGVKFPKKAQWKKFFSVLNKREKIYFSAFVFCFLASGIFLAVNFYFQNTKPSPAFGGSFTEGIVGQPRIINPLYLSTQDVDRDIVEIIFSGLMKYDGNGQIIKDLVKDYSIKEQDRVFEVVLRDNIQWHDGKPLTADDVLFTINLIQNPEYQSPLRVKWAGIVAEKIDSKTVSFKLPKKYAGFLETLTVKILPKHIFENVSPQNLPLSLVSEEYLVGSGPFKLKKIVHDQTGFIKKIILERNKNYYTQKPFLKEISLAFFEDDKDVKKAIALDDINGLGIADLSSFKNEVKKLKVFSLAVPRYFAVFFNAKKEGVFSDPKLKTALALATNRQAIIENVFLAKLRKPTRPFCHLSLAFKNPKPLTDTI